MAEIGAVDLTEDDRAKVDTWLSSPLGFPSEFKTWILDHLAVNIPPIPVSQFVGFVQTKALYADIPTSEHLSITAYGDLATPGPEITRLANGRYVFFFGGFLTGVGGSWDGYMALSVNGATPSDNDAIFKTSGSTFGWVGTMMVDKSLTSNDNNSVKALYKRSVGTATSPHWGSRWLVAIRYA